jgi:hypothetical protein
MTITISLILIPFLYAILQKALPDDIIMRKVHSYMHLLMISVLITFGIATYSSVPNNLGGLVSKQVIEFRDVQAGSTNFVTQNIDIIVRGVILEISSDIEVVKTEINITAVRDNIKVYVVGELGGEVRDKVLETLADTLQIRQKDIKIYGS